MIKFKSFLVEQTVGEPTNNESSIVIRKIIDMIDDGHATYGNDSIRFNVGKLIKNKKYGSLYVIIKKGEGEHTPSRHEDGNKHAIKLYSKELPQRHALSKFLSKPSIVTAFKKCFDKYYTDSLFDDNSEDTEDEKKKSINNREQFEALYMKMVREVESNNKKYKEAKKHLEDKLKNTSDDIGEGEIIKLSLKNLKKDMIGDSLNDFKSKALELFGKENYSMLDKEYKEKLDSRIEDYYEYSK